MRTRDGLTLVAVALRPDAESADHLCTTCLTCSNLTTKWGNPATMRRGYTSFSYETLDPDTQKAPDTKEGLYFGREVPEDSEEANKPLHGPNQWPDEVRTPCHHNPRLPGPSSTGAYVYGA